MKIARENLISGLVVIALGLVFLSQAFGLEQANATEGIHPMDYPKALTWLFIAVGCCIVLCRRTAAATRIFRCFRRGRRRFPGFSSPMRCCWITWDSA